MLRITTPLLAFEIARSVRFRGSASCTVKPQLIRADRRSSALASCCSLSSATVTSNRGVFAAANHFDRHGLADRGLRHQSPAVRARHGPTRRELDDDIAAFDPALAAGPVFYHSCDQCADRPCAQAKGLGQRGSDFLDLDAQPSANHSAMRP